MSQPCVCPTGRVACCDGPEAPGQYLHHADSRVRPGPDDPGRHLCCALGRDAPARMGMGMGMGMCGVRVIATSLLSLGGVVATAEIVVSRVSQQAGAVAVSGRRSYLATEVSVDPVNAQGRMNAQPILFVLEDDQYKPEEVMRMVGAVAQLHQPVALFNLFGSTVLTARLTRQTLEQLRMSTAGVMSPAAMLCNPGCPWMLHTAACGNAQQSRIFCHLATLSFRRIAAAYQHPFCGRAGLTQVQQRTQVVRRNRRAPHHFPERHRLEGRSATAQVIRRQGIHHAVGAQQRSRSSVGRARRRQCRVDLRRVLHLRQRFRRGSPTAGGTGYRSCPNNVQSLRQRVRTQALLPRHDARVCVRAVPSQLTWWLQPTCDTGAVALQRAPSAWRRLTAAQGQSCGMPSRIEARSNR